MSRWASYDDARDVLEVDDDDCCPDCLGEGCYHDCGEDTCCCAYPDDYRFVGTRSDVKKMLGNAWSVRMATALCSTILERWAPARPALNEEVA